MAYLGIENTGAGWAGRAGEGGEGDGSSFYVQCDCMNPGQVCQSRLGALRKFPGTLPFLWTEVDLLSLCFAKEQPM